jgi:uncharacterized protein YuzE
MSKKNEFQFGLTVETQDATGKVMAVYFTVRKGTSYKVKEYDNGNVFADYDRSGKLLGIEMLAPSNAKVLDEIAVDAPVRKFVRGAIPIAMLCAS